MTKVNTIIVEDSPQNLEALQTLLQKECPQIKLMGAANNIDDAYTLIKTNHPNLLFLDIELKEGSTTFELLERLYEESLVDFEIIFVTAYGKFEYATKAINYAALDFITKPIDSEKLRHAVNKATEKIGQQQYMKRIELLMEILEKGTSTTINRMAFHLTKGVIEFVEVNDIVYLEADGTVTNVYLSKGQQLTAVRNLGYYSKLLMSDYSFFPISHKDLVNLNYVKRYKHSERTLFLTTGSYLLASRRGGQDFKMYLNKNKKDFDHLERSGIRNFFMKFFNN